MTHTIVVAPDDKQLFLDKVISFGIDHGILTLERRRELARESADFSQAICQKYRLNASDIQDVLTAARIVHQLTSIALERASQQGNIFVAAHLLATTKVGALVGLVLLIVDSAYRRVWRVAYNVYHLPDDSFFGRQKDFEHITGILSLRHAPLLQDKAMYSQKPMNIISEEDKTANLKSLYRSLRVRQRKVVLSMRTSHDLDQWLNEIETAARELITQSARKRKRRQ